MEITLLVVEGCPHADVALSRIHDALGRLGVNATVRDRVVRSDEEAAATGMRGSPTILVDGSDLLASAGPPSMSCRLDVPTVDDIVDQLARHHPHLA